MIDETPNLKAIHALYCQLANAQLAFTTERIYWWSAYFARGFTEEDLKLVLRYLWHEIKGQRRNIGAIKFSNMIQDISRFEEDLGLARGWCRNAKPKPTPKQRVQAQWRPIVAEPVAKTARPIGEWIAELRRAAG